MKRIIFCVIALILTLTFGCSNEALDDARSFKAKNTKEQPAGTIEVYSPDVDGDYCYSTQLIAGQHYEAGTVSIHIDGEYLMVSYETSDEWSIGTTHLTIGNCEEGWAPTTNSGNPKIGDFEFTEPSYQDDDVVIYAINLEDLNVEGNFCFAAHAEVQGPDGEETAWAAGSEFGGRSWAMYVETNLSNCESDDDDNNTPY